MNQQPVPSHRTSRHIKIDCQWRLVVIQAYEILELIKGFIVVQWRLVSQRNKIYYLYRRLQSALTALLACRESVAARKTGVEDLLFLCKIWEWINRLSGGVVYQWQLASQRYKIWCSYTRFWSKLTLLLTCSKLVVAGNSNFARMQVISQTYNFLR
jgi:hypothetical protein